MQQLAGLVGHYFEDVRVAADEQARPVLRYHLSQRKTDQEALVESRLRIANADPAVCNAIRALNVKYVLDFGDQYLLNHKDSKRYLGLQDLASSDAVTLVDQEGEAKLYKVTACW